MKVSCLFCRFDHLSKSAVRHLAVQDGARLLDDYLGS